MNATRRTWLGALFGSHLFLAIAFWLALLAPQLPFATSPGDARLIVVLEGISLLACVLVGGFVPVAYTFFPLIVLAVVAWLFVAGSAGFSLGAIGFVWGIVAAFREGLRAHRGELGFARENPDHPHRRYDRVVMLYFAVLPIVPVLWALGVGARWQVCGALYFSLVAASDTFLRDPIDRIPRALLRRMQGKTDPELAARLGQCATCMYVQPAIGHPDGKPVRCVLSTQNPRLAEFPDTPTTDCPGYQPRP